MTPLTLSEIEQTTLHLLSKMASLSFSAKFERAEGGPIVTQYFFKPGPEAILSKITARAEDLALAVNAQAITIQRIGGSICIAVPNVDRKVIDFNSCLYWMSQNTEMHLPMLMGQTPKGENFALDLVTQPHMLIAGSTGSGKSVFLSQLITSLCALKSEHELKFLMVDTKQLDLTLFKPLPHVIDVVDQITDLHDHMARLLAIVRQRTAAMKGVARNLIEYNRMTTTHKLPFYILIIDELADVISQDKELGKSEDPDNRRVRIATSLAQLAQISRAAGVHIIAATQRPSVQVISGDIKTNFPTRISFRLPTSVDSRVILDENGAENLLGRGDYFYRTSDDFILKRAHSAYVTMNDIGAIITHHEDIRRSLRAGV
jgi:S-DNA-T family DNA segregation ATPase FtsK/SpoIIIE